MKSIKDPKNLTADISNSFKLLETDLKRQKKVNDTVTFPLDFSEIYGYLFPEFSQTRNRRISRLLLNSKKNSIQYGLFPPAIAEFFLHFYKLYKSIDGYSNRKSKISIRSHDISTYILKMNPTEPKTNPVGSMNQSEQFIHLIITLSDKNIVQNSISNPCKNFNILREKLIETGSLKTVEDVLPSKEQKVAFFKNKDTIVYDSVYKYLSNNPGRNPKVKSWMEDYNRIDALLAHQSYILNKYYYGNTNNYFSIFTSSAIPSRAMEQKNILFSDLPFNKTPLYRDPIYLVCREAYLNNVSDIDELIKTIHVSADILKKIEKQDISTLNFTNDEISPSFNAVYSLLDTIMSQENQQDGLKQMVMNSVVARFSRHTVEDKLSNPTSEKTYFELKSSLDDYITFEKEKYENDFDEIQGNLKETLNELYLKLYPVVEDSDFFSISPKMMEMKERIIEG